MKLMSFSETIFLFFLALIIFGPKKLPEIARQVGKMMNEFRRASNEFKAQIEQEIAHIEVEERKRTILPPSSPVEGTASRTLKAAPSVTAYPASYPESLKPSESAPDAPATGAGSNEPVVVVSAPVNGNPPDETPATEAVASSSTTSQESHA